MTEWWGLLFERKLQQWLRVKTLLHDEVIYYVSINLQLPRRIQAQSDRSLHRYENVTRQVCINKLSR